MKILSIQIGTPKTVLYQGRSVTTGIFKDAVAGPAELKTFGIVGDGQADLKVHGGRDKALYAFSHDVYALWSKLRPQDEFPFGAFGENLTLDFLPEDKLCVGDTYSLGHAIVQVSQPRYPCQKLGIKFNDAKIVKQFMDIARPGVYFRVLKEGAIQAGDSLVLLSTEKVRLSILELFHFPSQKEFMTEERIQAILTLPLPLPWREKFESCLAFAAKSR